MPFWRSAPRKTVLLERLPLFAGLSRRELSQISRLMDEVEVPAGKRLATSSQPGHEMFIIVDGRAEVTTRAGRRVYLGPGDFFGEMSLLDGEPRSANVEAATAMRVFALGTRQFWQLLNESPGVTRKIMQALSRRIRQSEHSPTA